MLLSHRCVSQPSGPPDLAGLPLTTSSCQMPLRARPPVTSGRHNKERARTSPAFLGLSVLREPILIKKPYRDLITNSEERLEIQVGGASRVYCK